MGWAPGGSPSPTSIRRCSASGRQINSATRCCTPFDGVELGGRQPKQSACMTTTSSVYPGSPTPFRSPPLSVLQATGSLARFAWIFGKQL